MLGRRGEARGRVSIGFYNQKPIQNLSKIDPYQDPGSSQFREILGRFWVAILGPAPATAVIDGLSSRGRNRAASSPRWLAPMDYDNKTELVVTLTARDAVQEDNVCGNARRMAAPTVDSGVGPLASQGSQNKGKVTFPEPGGTTPP